MRRQAIYSRPDILFRQLATEKDARIQDIQHVIFFITSHAAFLFRSEKQCNQSLLLNHALQRAKSGRTDLCYDILINNEHYLVSLLAKLDSNRQPNTDETLNDLLGIAHLLEDEYHPVLIREVF